MWGDSYVSLIPVSLAHTHTYSHQLYVPARTHTIPTCFMQGTSKLKGSTRAILCSTALPNTIHSKRREVVGRMLLNA